MIRAGTRLGNYEVLAPLGAGGMGEVYRARDYTLQIVSGLAAAHAKGIVHRDLKPENLFVTSGQRPFQRETAAETLTAILRYQDRTVEPVVAGRELGVHAVVDGSFQRSGSRLRVTVQLVATDDGRSLWGSKIDTTLDDIFRMQDEVSRRIAEALEVELSPADERRLARAARPAGKANDLYLKGRAHLFFERIEDVNAAIEDFEKALREDPRSVHALVGLATAYARMGFTFDPEGDWLERAEAMGGKALSIDPGLPEGRCLKGLLAWTPRRGFDHAGAIREFLAAVAGSPNLTEAHERLGVVLFHVAMLEDSAAHARQALATNPDDTLAKIHLGFCRYLEGRHEEALDLSLAAERGNPSAWGDYQIALCHFKLGDFEAALRRAEQGSRRAPGDPLSSSLRGLIAASCGDAAGAREQIALTLRNRKSFGHYHHAQYDMACIHALLGEKDAAVDLLTEASRNGFPCYSFFERDPSLVALRREERFTALMKDLEAECDGYHRLYRQLADPRGDSGSGRAQSPSD